MARGSLRRRWLLAAACAAGLCAPARAAGPGYAVIVPKRGGASFEPISRNGSQRGGRPFVEFLRSRVKDVKIVAGEDLRPVVADDFILVPNPGVCDPAKDYRIVFRAERIGAP